MYIYIIALPLFPRTGGSAAHLGGARPLSRPASAYERWTKIPPTRRCRHLTLDQIIVNASLITCRSLWIIRREPVQVRRPSSICVGVSDLVWRRRNDQVRTATTFSWIADTPVDLAGWIALIEHFATGRIFDRAWSQGTNCSPCRQAFSSDPRPSVRVNGASFHPASLERKQESLSTLQESLTLSATYLVSVDSDRATSLARSHVYAMAFRLASDHFRPRSVPKNLR